MSKEYNIDEHAKRVIDVLGITNKDATKFIKTSLEIAYIQGKTEMLNQFKREREAIDNERL